VIEPEEWTPENGFLTPSLKVKRRIVLSTYADDIAAIYDNT
jgi:long-subunit acyl-CoA synthetase (AMP-forming)